MATCFSVYVLVQIILLLDGRIILRTVHRWLAEPKLVEQVGNYKSAVIMSILRADIGSSWQHKYY